MGGAGTQPLVETGALSVCRCDTASIAALGHKQRAKAKSGPPTRASQGGFENSPDNACQGSDERALAEKHYLILTLAHRTFYLQLLKVNIKIKGTMMTFVRVCI